MLPSTLSSYGVYQYLMILRHSSGFRPSVFAVWLFRLASYSLTIQGQQSFAQQQDKVALGCYEYASKTKTASRHRYSWSRCYKYFFDNDEATTISIPSTLSSLWIVHNFLKLSGRFLQCIPSVDGCQHQVQAQSRTSKKNWRTLNFEHLILFFSICKCYTYRFASLVLTLI